MKYLLIFSALLAGGYGFSQTTTNSTTKKSSLEPAKEVAQPTPTKVIKAKKIERPVIDKYTKERAIEEPKKEVKKD